MILPVGLALAFAAYIVSELLLEGRWIGRVLFEHNWSESIRVASFAVAAVLIWLVSRLRYSEYQTIVEYEQRYQAILEKSLSGMVIYRAGAVLFLNRRIREMLGYEGYSLQERPLPYLELVHPEERKRVQTMVAARRKEGPIDLRYECRFLSRRGEVMWAEVVSFVIQYGGRPAVLVNVYDITEGKRAEEQLVHTSRLAELGEMAASVAHELNQPLTGIRNYADSASYMLENDAGDVGEVNSNLKLILEQVDRAARIINQLRDLSRLSASDHQLLNVNDMVRESVDFLSHQFRLSGVEVEVRLAEGLPPVNGDRVRLLQVLLNILTNARQAMDGVDRRLLTIGTRRGAALGGCVALEIEDTGVGFSAEAARKIFEPFYSTKKPGHGTGLGLSISQSIVEQHGGIIECEGREGVGATFRICLPAVEEGAGANGESDGRH